MGVEEVVRFYAFLAVAAVASAGGFALAWIRGRRRIRELEARLERDTTPQFAEDVEELREHLAGVSEQMVRLTEGQDFLARVVTEQSRSRDRSG